MNTTNDQTPEEAKAAREEANPDSFEPLKNTNKIEKELKKPKTPIIFHFSPICAHQRHLRAIPSLFPSPHPSLTPRTCTTHDLHAKIRIYITHNTLNPLEIFAMTAKRACISAALISLLIATGCATAKPKHSASPHGPAPTATPQKPFAPTDIRAFNARSGDALAWSALLDQASAADIVLIGELHDSNIGHAFQAAFIKDLCAKQKTALCIEMLDRNEQPFVDAYLQGRIASKTFITATQSADIGGPGKWVAWYQPLIDAAKASGSPVIAANAARSFTAIARQENFDALTSFAAAYPNQFVVPQPIEQAAYFERFKGTMTDHAPLTSPHKGSPKDKKKKQKPADHPVTMPAITPEMLEGFFRAQQVWDATMADSTLSAFRAHGKAVLTVGQFHVDNEGGIFLRLRNADPNLKILVISLQSVATPTLRAEDRNRADYVIYPVVADAPSE